MIKRKKMKLIEEDRIYLKEYYAVINIITNIRTKKYRQRQLLNENYKMVLYIVQKYLNKILKLFLN